MLAAALMGINDGAALDARTAAAHLSPPRPSGESAARRSRTPLPLLLLDAVQVIDDGEDACSYDDFPQVPRRIERVVGRINRVRRALDGIESFSPDRHFMSAVRGNCSPPIYGFINGGYRKDPVVVLGQGRQIGRRHLQLPSNRSFALSIYAMTACARSLKLRLTNIDIFSVSGRGETSGHTGNHERLQATDTHIMPQFFFG
ncbi:hypothetical protein ACVIHD_004261 [Bradyrhizobium embrapense]